MRLPTRVADWIGCAMNWLGWPGFMQSCDYRATTAPVNVQVRVGRLLTRVSVNGVDVYFCRLTGRIDGIGLSQASDCRLGEAPRSTGFAARPADSHHTARN